MVDDSYDSYDSESLITYTDRVSSRVRTVKRLNSV